MTSSGFHFLQGFAHSFSQPVLIKHLLCTECSSQGGGGWDVFPSRNSHKQVNSYVGYKDNRLGSGESNKSSSVRPEVAETLLEWSNADMNLEVTIWSQAKDIMLLIIVSLWQKQLREKDLLWFMISEGLGGKEAILMGMVGSRGMWLNSSHYSRQEATSPDKSPSPKGPMTFKSSVSWQHTTVTPEFQR